MRVGCIVYGSPEQLSGGYRYDRELMKTARDRGHEAEFISVERGAEFDPAGFDRYDLLLIDELCHPDLRLRAGAPPCVGIVHHLAWSEKLPLPVRLRHRIQEIRFLNGLDAHIFNTRATRRAAEKLVSGPLAGTVVYPGREGTSGEAEDQVRRRNHEGIVSLLSVSNLIPRKGIHRVLEALALVAQRGVPEQEWRYRIVGDETDPAYAARLRRIAARPELTGRVEFCGRLDERALGSAYAEADIFCLPSDHEGFGIVYLEAMGAGCVAIASASGGAGEIISSGRDGYLLASRSRRDLALLFSMLMGDAALRNTISSAARERWSGFDTWEESMEKGIAWLESFRSAGIEFSGI
jgi:glycosyltransferase involved in cell wall biosynthesis